MTPHPSTELHRLINGYQITQAIHVAATLGLANHLKGGPRPSDELASLAKAHPATLYRLLRALAAVGVFHEDEGRRFSLTPMGDCLRSDSPTPVGEWAAYVGRPYYWEAWGHLHHSVKTGENAFNSLHGKSVWQYRAEHSDESAIFDQAMTALSRGGVEALVKAYDFSRFQHIADIGGGRGQTIAGILAAHPTMRGTLFDQPHVVDKAPSLLTQAGVNDRCDVVAGSFFESVPSGADAYILRAIIHDWEDQEAISILKVCRQAMKAASTLLLVEQIVAPPNEGLVGKISDLNMLVMLGGRERTREEFAGLFAAASLTLVRTTSVGPRYSLIEAKPS
jgi:O-methyltransferase domain/Dimerisation domain